jgi:hypothetical protein
VTAELFFGILEGRLMMVELVLMEIGRVTVVQAKLAEVVPVAIEGRTRQRRAIANLWSIFGLVKSQHEMSGEGLVEAQMPPDQITNR